MAEKKNDTGFKVSDRRLFTSDGELRPVSEESDKSAEQNATTTSGKAAEAAAAKVFDTSESAAPRNNEAMPTPPAAAEQEAQHQAYKQSSRDLDARVELSGHSAKELEVTFEGFLATLYTTAMIQLGLMYQQGGQPTVDLIGARHTIDTLGMISDKTKGNLTPKEQGFLQNSLYELRMAYVEVTNALARAPQAPGPSTGTNG